MPAFKALAEVWRSSEWWMRHSKLGDFWGPVILYMRKFGNWMPIHEAFNTGFEHGFVPKSEDEIPEAWRRGECEAMADPHNHFTVIAKEVREVYAHADHVVGDELWRMIRTDGMDLRLVEPRSPEEDKVSESPDDPEKDLDELPKWCDDLEGLIQRNKDWITADIMSYDPALQGKLEEMAEKTKGIWDRATVDQKAAWKVRRDSTFGQEELHTRLLDITRSFESRWIPQ
jgi:hypothetical protein